MELEEIESIILSVLRKMPRGKHPVMVIPFLAPSTETSMSKEEFDSAIASLEQKGLVRTYEKISDEEKTVSLTTIDELFGTDFAYHKTYAEEDMAGIELTNKE